MKKRITAIALSLAIMCSVTLPGCALLEDKTVQATSSAMIIGPMLVDDIDFVIKNVTKLNNEKDIFTFEEVEILLNSIETFEAIRSEYEITVAMQDIPSISDAEIMWDWARESYSNALYVLQLHSDEYSLQTKMRLNLMVAHATQADAAVNVLLKDPTAINVSKVIEIAENAVTIGLRLGVIFDRIQ